MAVQWVLENDKVRWQADMVEVEQLAGVYL
jgi:hypothetical protein